MIHRLSIISKVRIFSYGLIRLQELVRPFCDVHFFVCKRELALDDVRSASIRAVHFIVKPIKARHETYCTRSVLKVNVISSVPDHLHQGSIRSCNAEVCRS